MGGTNSYHSSRMTTHGLKDFIFWGLKRANREAVLCCGGLECVKPIYLHDLESDNFKFHIVTGYRTRGMDRGCVTKNGEEDRC